MRKSVDFICQMAKGLGQVANSQVVCKSKWHDILAFPHSVDCGLCRNYRSVSHVSAELHGILSVVGGMGRRISFPKVQKEAVSCIFAFQPYSFASFILLFNRYLR